MNLAIVGAGLIGRKRAGSLPNGLKLTTVCDINEERGKQFAEEFGCSYTLRWEDVVGDPEVGALVVATTHDWLTPIAAGAIAHGKHVLIEKPGARSHEEFGKLIEAHRQNPVVVMLGYNHRYHPGIQKAKEIIDSKLYGEVMFIRAKYGHGARLGYEKEWRFVKEMSGGGELIDQGPHLIDLVNYLAGQFDEVTGFTGNLYWDTQLEDAAFWVMRSKNGQIAHLSVTCEEWKNVFCFEIMLKKAKIQIDGLGRSYGTEKLTLYKMKPEMGPPDVEEFEFPGDDLSWKIENEIFWKRIKNKDYSPTALENGLYVHRVISEIYKLNSKK